MKDQAGKTGLIFSSIPYPELRAGAWYRADLLVPCGPGGDGKVWTVKTSKNTSFHRAENFSPDAERFFQPGESSVAGTISFYREPQWYINCSKHRIDVSRGGVCKFCKSAPEKIVGEMTTQIYIDTGLKGPNPDVEVTCSAEFLMMTSEMCISQDQTTLEDATDKSVTVFFDTYDGHNFVTGIQFMKEERN